jgi:deazaflavin-dependent oxidoreductase (nitroreductase family)
MNDTQNDTQNESPNDTQYLYLTTRGRKTGNPHRIEIWYVAHAGSYYLVSERREGSHWVQNILNDPAITFSVGESNFAGKGRTVDPTREPELAQTVAALMDAKYGWSDGLIVELKPELTPEN